MAVKRKIISIHEKKPKGLTFGKFLYWIALLSFAGSVVYVFFFSGLLFIKQIEISGLEELNQENILDVINSEVQGKYFGVLERNNLLLARKGVIRKKLLEGFKKIESVKIQKKFPDTLLVGVKERESALIFCQNERCYVTDENGIAYSEKDYSLPEIKEEKLITLLDLGEKSTQIGERVLAPDYINYILGIGEKMKSNLDIETAKNYETPSRVSGDIRAAAVEGWKIYFSKDINLQKEIDMLRIVLDDKIGDKRKDLEYIDLRSDNKVYYKFKQGSQEEMNSSEDKNTEPEKKEDDKKEKKKKK